MHQALHVCTAAQFLLFKGALANMTHAVHTIIEGASINIIKCIFELSIFNLSLGGDKFMQHNSGCVQILASRLIVSLY
jgi:hypothetical protein